MVRTAYYSDQDFERFMVRSERKQKIQFYVWLGCSFVVHPIIFYILLTDELNFVSRVFLAGISVIALICLVGLWYCYWSTKRSIRSYRQMKAEQQAEVQALLEEAEEKRWRKRDECY